MDNLFKFKGKFAGVESNRFTPGGLKINEFTVAVKVLVPWKEAYYSNINVKCCEALADYSETLKTGDLINVEGIIEAVGKQKAKTINLIATKIEKEN